MKIFICHSWETHSNEYLLLCEFISQTLKSWTNLSIPKSEPYHFWKSGKIAWESQNKISERRLNLLSSKLSTLHFANEKILAEVTNLNRDSHFGSTVEEIDKKLLYAIEYLEGTISDIFKRREELKKRAENRKKIIASSNFKQLKYYETELTSIQEKIHNVEVELNKIKDRLSESYESFHSLEEFAVNDEYVIKSGKFGRTVRYYPAILKEEIYNRILDCDIFIVIAGMFSFYKQWMEFELDLASKEKKYIIALLPIDQESLPKEVLNVCSDFSPFKFEEIEWRFKYYCSHTAT